MALPKNLSIHRNHCNRRLAGKVTVVFVFLGPILVPLLWLSGVPLFMDTADFSWSIGQAICAHTEKSFTIGGEPMMVCARCFGACTGLLVTSLLYYYTGLLRARLPRNRLHLATIIALLFMPWLIDSALQRLDLWQTDMWLMFPTGFLGGSALVLAPFLFSPLPEKETQAEEKLEPDFYLPEAVQ